MDYNWVSETKLKDIVLESDNETNNYNIKIETGLNLERLSAFGEWGE